MTGSPHSKKKSYSAVYKIYRRIRYIRHRKRSIRKLKEEIRINEAREKNELKQNIIDHVRSEKARRRAKSRADRKEARILAKQQTAEIRLRRDMLKVELQEQKQAEKLRQKQEKKRAKLERRRMARQYLKISGRNFVRSFRSINARTIRGHIHEFRESAPIRKKFFLVAFNSTILYLASYLFLFLVAQAVTVIAAGFFDYPTIVYYHEIYFNISPEAWYHDSVKTIFSAGPMVNLVIGISFLIIYMNIREMNGTFKLFFLWGFLHAVNMLFGAMLVGTLFETGVGHVISWMYVMDTGRVVYSIISIFILVIAGLATTRSFLISGNSYFSRVDEHNRSLLIIPQVLLPYLLGNAFLIGLRQPRFIYYDTFVGVTMILSLVPILVVYRSYHALYFEEETKRPRPQWMGLLILVLLVIVFRGLLAIGLSFGG